MCSVRCSQFNGYTTTAQIMRVRPIAVNLDRNMTYPIKFEIDYCMRVEWISRVCVCPCIRHPCEQPPQPSNKLDIDECVAVAGVVVVTEFLHVKWTDKTIEWAKKNINKYCGMKPIKGENDLLKVHMWLAALAVTCVEKLQSSTKRKWAKATRTDTGDEFTPSLMCSHRPSIFIAHSLLVAAAPPPNRVDTPVHSVKCLS